LFQLPPRFTRLDPATAPLCQISISQIFFNSRAVPTKKHFKIFRLTAEIIFWDSSANKNYSNLKPKGTFSVLGLLWQPRTTKLALRTRRTQGHTSRKLRS
jgi:hypothetical protein